MNKDGRKMCEVGCEPAACCYTNEEGKSCAISSFKSCELFFESCDTLHFSFVGGMQVENPVRTSAKDQEWNDNVVETFSRFPPASISEMKYTEGAAISDTVEKDAIDSELSVELSEFVDFVFDTKTEFEADKVIP